MNDAQAAYNNGVLGVQLADTAGLQILEDEILDERTYGVTLVTPKNEGDEGHEGGDMVLRIGLLHNAAPDLDKAVEDVLAQYPELTADQTTITLSDVQGTVLQSVPGRFGSTNIYVVANDQLYEIIYANDTLDATGQSLVNQILFVPPTDTVASLGLQSPTDLSNQPSPYPSNVPKLPEGIDVSDAESDEGLEATSPPDTLGVAANGCAHWPTSLFIQTPITQTANGTGRTTAGPDHYGIDHHVKCNVSNQLNDHFALDYPLRVGDEVLAPFAGTVKWAGWAKAGWAGLGRIVIVEKVVGSNKYWSMAAHLSKILVQAGDAVTFNTIIGLAGASGHGNNNHWSPHLHQGIYLNAKLDAVNGGIFGGQSVQQRNVSFFGNGGGTYAIIQAGQVISW